MRKSIIPLLIKGSYTGGGSGSMAKGSVFYPDYRVYTDFRSDTVTFPTQFHLQQLVPSLRGEMMGDDVYGEDMAVHRLEEKVADLVGHESALFCATGTMTNQLALRCHLTALTSVIVDARSHVHKYECGGIALHSQAMTIPILPSPLEPSSNNYFLTAKDISDHIIDRDGDLHTAPTALISLENTMNGNIYPWDELENIHNMAQSHGIAIHLDGARIWNASAETGISMSQYGRLFDSMSLCLSKGIGAPIGSILTGSRDFIVKARHFRKAFGGGWRQAGLLAEIAINCIDKSWPLMRKDHDNARVLAKGLKSLGFKILNNKVETNMVFVCTKDLGITVSDWADYLREHGKILISAVRGSPPSTTTRLVLHNQISTDQIKNFLDQTNSFLKEGEKKVE